MKKLFLVTLSSFILFADIAAVNAAYPKVECSTDSVYSQYSCNECFDWGEVKNGGTIAFLDDVWKNDSSNDKVMFKEDQSLPKMIALNSAKFEQNPTSNEDFWEYTSELEALYSTGADGYVLKAGQEVSWLKSTLGSAYKADTATNAKGTNIGLLVFDLMGHNILTDGQIVMSDKPHKECVLYKSAQAEEVVTPEIPQPEVAPEPPKEMTQVKTGPEMYFVVLILSFLIGMVWTNRHTIFSRK